MPIMNTIKTTKAKIDSALNTAFIRTQALLSSKRGEGYADTGVKVLIVVVIGDLLLGGLYTLFKTVMHPTLNTTGSFQVNPQYGCKCSCRN